MFWCISSQWFVHKTLMCKRHGVISATLSTLGPDLDFGLHKGKHCMTDFGFTTAPGWQLGQCEHTVMPIRLIYSLSAMLRKWISCLSPMNCGRKLKVQRLICILLGDISGHEKIISLAVNDNVTSQGNGSV